MVCQLLYFGAFKKWTLIIACRYVKLSLLTIAHLYNYPCLLRGSWHHDWVFSLLSKIQHKHRMQIFSWLYAWNFEHISIYLSKPTIRSWWNQWGVMAASPCNWWWRWWVWYSVSDTQGYDLQSCLLCWFFLLGWKLSPWIPFKLLLWNSLCNLIDMIVDTSWTLSIVKSLMVWVFHDSFINT
jgi:hypothetical protein